MTRLRTLPALRRPVRLKRSARPFDDDESDETILGLGFIETRNTPDAGAADQPVTSD